MSHLVPLQPAVALATLALSALALSACGSSSGSTSDGTTGSSSTSSSTSGRHRASTALAEARRRTARKIRYYGHEATASQAQQAEVVLHDYLDARAASRWGKACSYLAKGVHRLYGQIASSSKQIQGQGCAGFVDSATNKLSPAQRTALAKSEVDSVRLEGERGYVLYSEAGGAEYATVVKREAGEWKIVGSVGAPLK